MHIIGIDPGIDRMGFAILKHNKNSNPNLIDYGLITTNKSDQLPKRLNEIAKDFVSLIKKYKVKVLGIEKLFFSKNIKTATQISNIIGIILQHAEANKLEIIEFSPTKIKSNFTGNGNADKKSIGKMVKIVFNLEEIPKPDDVCDAIAIGYCTINEI